MIHNNTAIEINSLNLLANSDEHGIPVKVLIVDDNPVNLNVMEQVLENEKYQVVKAHSGKESLDIILENDIALIFMDVRMPIMDGFEAACLIRDREESSHIPIIFLTGYAD